MNLVDDEDLVFEDGGKYRGVLDDVLANVINTGLGGGVDLDDVDVAAAVDLGAGGAFIARFRGALFSFFAAHGLGKEPRQGGLADSARPGEKISMCNAIKSDLVLQSLDDSVLAGYVSKDGGTIFAVQGGHK